MKLRHSHQSSTKFPLSLLLSVAGPLISVSLHKMLKCSQLCNTSLILFYRTILCIDNRFGTQEKCVGCQNRCLGVMITKSWPRHFIMQISMAEFTFSQGKGNNKRKIYFCFLWEQYLCHKLFKKLQFSNHVKRYS